MERQLAKKFETAKRAADTLVLKGVMATADEKSRCLDALSQIKTLPVTSRLLASTKIVKPLQTLTHHRSKKIRSIASCLLQTWQPVINQTKISIRTRSSSTTVVGNQRKSPEKKIKKEWTQDIPVRGCQFTYSDGASRFMVRELLAEALSKVEIEVGDELRDSVSCCDPVEVAESVESVMFEKLGAFNGHKTVTEFAKRTRYTLIMFAMNDPKNQDLRRSVLLGEISPERLVGMKAEEIAKNFHRPGGERKQVSEFKDLLKPVAACMHRLVSLVH